MTRLKNLFALHAPLILFFTSVLILLLGMVDETGFKHIDKILLLLVSLFSFYFIFLKFNVLKKFVLNTLAKVFAFKSENLNIFLFILTITLFVIDVIVLKGLPGFRIFNIETNREFSDIRLNVHLETPTIFKYLSSINIRAILPFALLHFFIIRSKLYYPLLILAPVYAFSLMPKSYLLYLFIPVMLYAFFNKRYWHFVSHAVIVLGVMFVLIWYPLTLINVDPGAEFDAVTGKVIIPTEDPGNPVLRVIRGTSERMFMLPGRMVSHWFEALPEKKPFLYGDGYPFLAKLRGHEYRNYELELYAVFYPEYAAVGYKGSVNAATFVREYANFGYAGLVLAGAILAFSFYMMSIIFNGNLLLCLCINLYPIFLLTSGNILTLMFSGGWALALLLFFIYKNQYPEVKARENAQPA